MSFEGYYQCICQNGHHYRRDVYDGRHECEICEGDSEWENLVDETNGENSGWMDMDIFLQENGKYRIPTRLEELLHRTYETREGVFPLATPQEIAKARLEEAIRFPPLPFP